MSFIAHSTAIIDPFNLLFPEIDNRIELKPLLLLLLERFAQSVVHGLVLFVSRRGQY